MTTESYAFKVGEFKCTIVLDGTFAYPHPSAIFFANAPQEQLASILQAHDIALDSWTEYLSPYPSLLVETGSHRVLIDTGAGAMAPTTGQLISNLHSLGIAPNDIDTVILSHGHGDHINGNLNSDGKPAFANARYVMLRREWDFWTNEPDLSALAVDDHLKELIRASAEQNLPPIESHLTLVEDGDEITPGIHAIAAPGHTPGHMAISIASAGEKLLYMSDTLLHPVHLERPDWVAAVDLLPEETVTTRHKLLGQATVEGTIVHMYHFPFPGLGHVVAKGQRWEWQAIIP